MTDTMTLNDAMALQPAWLMVWINILLLGAFILPIGAADLEAKPGRRSADPFGKRDCGHVDQHAVQQHGLCETAGPAASGLLDAAAGVLVFPNQTSGHARVAAPDHVCGHGRDRDFAGL